ncbi:MAG: ATP phosphoribosyltransferase [Pseudomonadales bacterium]|jgi:ATP phosphoribosyltransferase|nr:ATP phosphoribosyltransferase [Pseudomonadales bacterium]
MSDQQLVIALTKGRILDEVLPLLEHAGVIPAEDINKSRKLIFDSNLPNVRLMVIRGSDVPTYVELGSADIGIAGKDMIMEYGSRGFYEPLDLKIASCRLMTAAPVGAKLDAPRLKVASKFVNVAKQYFSEQGRQVDIIKLNGALELAPLMGLADCIVDIVDTGNTLRANGLEAREVIAEVSTRVIVNRAAMKIKHALVQNLLMRLERAVA